MEINNEASVKGYSHSILQRDGMIDAVRRAKKVSAGEILVSVSWSGGIQPPGSRGDQTLRLVDRVMFHTSGQSPEQVHSTIATMRHWLGYSRPVVINEDGVSTFNLQAATQERASGGFYDHGWNETVETEIDKILRLNIDPEAKAAILFHNAERIFGRAEHSQTVQR